jgi:hypothetical protein
MTATQTTRTKVINGTTYYQEPTNADVWYDDPQYLGRPGCGWILAELPEMIRDRDAAALEIANIEAGLHGDGYDLNVMRDELERIDSEVALLVALAA